VSTLKRLLIPSAALLWGLQFAFLNPALALLLVALFDATAAEVGWVLAVYNGSGFVASLVLPAYADRKGNYLWPLLACGLLTLALAVLLYVTTSFPIAVIGLLVLGGPAGVGSSLLFAHLKYSGASPSEVANTRAIVSVAWVAGPPLATFIIGTFGDRAVLLAIAAVAVLNRPRLANAVWLWGVFAVCAALTVLALVAIGVAARITKRGTDLPGTEIAPKGERQGHP
jgi:MFS transporter, SET family, sugar efflux transporter